MRVRPLNDLLTEHCKDQPIDFLKIDVEGWELEVLKGIDLRRFRPTIILAEATVPQTRVTSHAEWEPLVLAGGYSFVYFDGVNRFYVANERSELSNFFSSPPNAFDDFEAFPLVRARTDAEQRLKLIKTLEDRLVSIERDCADRLAANRELQLMLTESQRDHAARLDAIEDLKRSLAQSEQDRHARLETIHELQQKLSESDSDRTARLYAIDDLKRLLTQSEQDRTARLEAIQKLQDLLSECESDRSARLEAIHDLERMLSANGQRR